MARGLSMLGQSIGSIQEIFPILLFLFFLYQLHSFGVSFGSWVWLWVAMNYDGWHCNGDGSSYGMYLGMENWIEVPWSFWKATCWLTSYISSNDCRNCILCKWYTRLKAVAYIFLLKYKVNKTLTGPKSEQIVITSLYDDRSVMLVPIRTDQTISLQISKYSRYILVAGTIHLFKISGLANEYISVIGAMYNVRLALAVTVYS